MQTIEAAKQEAIATQKRMPKKLEICNRAGVSQNYFTSKNPSARTAFKAYIAAREEAELTATNVPKKRKYVSVKKHKEPRLTFNTKTQPEKVEGDSKEELQRKERQLLAHLERFGSVYLRSLTYKLNLSPSDVGAMVQRLKRQGLISINQSPFDKTGNEAAIVLANQQRRAG